MKKVSLVLGLGLALVGFSAFTGNTQAPTTTTNAIEWTGSKVVGGSHNGTIDIKDAKLVYKNGVLSGGTVVADMQTLKNLDLEGEYNGKLVGHLKSDDFFAVEKFPTATLKITKISKVKDANTYNIVANMTVKGITHAESFVANVSEVDGNYVATADVTIDRSKYDVRYGSTSFFDDLGDKAINNDFTLKVTIATPMK
jgi:polyisoprenoid-binding protein YceI